MSNKAREDRFVLVWERGNYYSTHLYTADEYNEQFSEEERAQLLSGHEVDGVVDLVAYYHRASDYMTA